MTDTVDLIVTFLTVLSASFLTVQTLVIACKEVDYIDPNTESNSEILFFYNCAKGDKCKAEIIRYKGEKYWSCTAQEMGSSSNGTTTAADDDDSSNTTETTTSVDLSINLDMYMNNFSVYQTSSGCFYLNPLQVVSYNDHDRCQSRVLPSGTFVNLAEPEVEILSVNSGYGHEYWLGVRYIDGTYTWLASNESLPNPPSDGSSEVDPAVEAPDVESDTTLAPSVEQQEAADSINVTSSSNATTAKDTDATTVTTDATRETTPTTTTTSTAATPTTASADSADDDDSILKECISNLRHNFLNVLCDNSKFRCEFYT